MEKGEFPTTHTPFGGAEAESFHAFYEDRLLSAVAIALLTPGIEGLNGRTHNQTNEPAFLVVVRKEDAHVLVCRRQCLVC